PALLVLDTALLHLPASEPDVPHFAVDAGNAHDERVHWREAPLPDGVWQHDRDHVPPLLERAQPGLGRRRDEEVREDEHERAGRHRPRVRDEEIERLLDVLRGRLEARALVLALLVLPERL